MKWYPAWLGVITATALLLSACNVAPKTPAGGATGGANNSGKPASSTGKYALKVWFHTGNGPEREAIQAQVDAFNKNQDQVNVDLIMIPEGNYDDQVKAAAASGDLPDVLDFDGPFLYNYAWNKNLIPLDSYVSDSLKNDLLPSIIKQGTYAGHLYGIGTFDSGLGLFARKSVLEKARIRIPQGIKDAWTADEFTQALKKLQAMGFKKPLDLKYNYGRGEWFTYGFSSIIQSAGGDLIDRSTFKKADGVLNTAASVKALTIFQRWFKDGLVNYNEGDNAFVSGQAAISWVGHWQYNAYKKAFGDDLLILPLPNFGQGTKTGMGSWQWGITSNTKNADAAWAFIKFLLQPDEVLRMTGANGAVPALKSAAAKSPEFAPGGPLNLYVQQLQGIAVPRPQTPAYPTITSAFSQAIQNISEGKDVKVALDQAVKAIDQDIEDNQGYPMPMK